MGEFGGRFVSPLSHPLLLPNINDGLVVVGVLADHVYLGFGPELDPANLLVGLQLNSPALHLVQKGLDAPGLLLYDVLKC